MFTSLRVTDGRGHDLDGHLARLDDSAWQLFGKHLPPSLHTDLAACLAGRPSGRLRLTARPVGGPLQVTVEVIPAGPAPETVALHPVTIPGGLGRPQVAGPPPARPLADATAGTASARMSICSSRTTTGRSWRPTGPTCSR